MAILNLSYLKTLFETYDKPTEEDFADLIDTLSTTIKIITYNVSGTNDVWADVNGSTQIRYEQKTLVIIYHNGVTYLFNAPLGVYGMAGIQTGDTNYVNIAESQFTDTQVEQILNLIAIDITVATSLDVGIFEKGVETLATYIANMDYGDAEISSIKLNNVSYSVYPSGSSTIETQSLLYESKAYNLVIDYTLNGVIKEYNETLNAIAYSPQYCGLSNVLDYDGYISSNILLDKFIVENSNISFERPMDGSYVWFILNSDDTNIIDQNGLRFSHSDWSSTYFYISKTGFITLEDGSNEPVTFYRSLSVIDSNNVDYKFEST